MQGQGNETGGGGHREPDARPRGDPVSRQPGSAPSVDTAAPLPGQDAFLQEEGLGKLTTFFLGLVRAVATVILPVTLPACWDAAA